MADPLTEIATSVVSGALGEVSKTAVENFVHGFKEALEQEGVAAVLYLIYTFDSPVEKDVLSKRLEEILHELGVDDDNYLDGRRVLIDYSFYTMLDEILEIYTRPDELLKRLLIEAEMELEDSELDALAERVIRLTVRAYLHKWDKRTLSSAFDCLTGVLRWLSRGVTTRGSYSIQLYVKGDIKKSTRLASFTYGSVTVITVDPLDRKQVKELLGLPGWL